MNNRPVDKTKKSNIKCEHCKWWKKVDWNTNICEIKKAETNYYNRCKSFEWAESEEV